MFYWLISWISVVCVCACVCVCTCVHMSTCVCAQLLSNVRLFGLGPTRLLCPWKSPGKNTRVHCYFLLQKIFLTQGLNSHLTTETPWKWISMEDPSKDNISREKWDGRGIPSGRTFMNKGTEVSLRRMTMGISVYSFLLKLIYFLAAPSLSCGMWDLVCWSGIEPGQGPLNWEHRVLATGPPGKSLCVGPLGQRRQ